MKEITVMCFERGDWYWYTLDVDEEETLRESLAKVGICEFLVLDVDPNDSEAVQNEMTVNIRVL